jgi:hypothetical protein
MILKGKLRLARIGMAAWGRSSAQVLLHGAHGYPQAAGQLRSISTIIMRSNESNSVIARKARRQKQRSASQAPPDPNRNSQAQIACDQLQFVAWEIIDFQLVPRRRNPHARNIMRSTQFDLLHLVEEEIPRLTNQPSISRRNTKP